MEQTTQDMRNSPSNFGQQNRLKGAIRQRGLTLVELMVSLVLGLVLIGGVLNIFVANRETFRVTENLTRMQENARTGFDFMARDIREAGQNPCGTGLVANVLRDAGGAIPWWADWNKGTIIGVDGSQDRTDIVAFGTATNDRIAGTDAVLIIRADQDEKIIDTHDTATTLITLTSPSTFQENDVVMACDLLSAAIFQLYDSTPHTGAGKGKVLDHQMDVTNTNCSSFLGYPTPATCPVLAPTAKQFKDSTSPPSAIVTKLVSSFWYVGPNGNGQRSLYRTKIKRMGSGATIITTEPEEIVPGVQDLQMQYLVKSATTGTLATDWVDATDGATFPGATSTATGNWRTDDPTNQPNQAVAVRITMTLQSDEKVGTDQLPIQRQLIHVVGLRSRDTLF